MLRCCCNKCIIGVVSWALKGTATCVVVWYDASSFLPSFFIRVFFVLITNSIVVGEVFNTIERAKIQRRIEFRTSSISNWPNSGDKARNMQNWLSNTRQNLCASWHDALTSGFSDWLRLFQVQNHEKARRIWTKKWRQNINDTVVQEIVEDYFFLLFI